MGEGNVLGGLKHHNPERHPGKKGRSGDGEEEGKL